MHWDSWMLAIREICWEDAGSSVTNSAQVVKHTPISIIANYVFKVVKTSPPLAIA